MCLSFRFVAFLVMIGGVATSVVSAVELKAPWMRGEVWSANGSFYGENLHTGDDYYCIDFNWGSGSADLGMPILATADGVVSWSGWSDGYGWNVRLDLGSNTTDQFAHFNTKPVVVVGENVHRGQVIGFCGGSGGNYSPHLHYGRFISGISVPPSPFDGQTMNKGGAFSSTNSNMIDLQFESNGGSIKYGSGNPNDSIHWYHVYDPNNLYRGGNVPNNCYVQNWHGGQYGDCGIVYDALGGARRAYTVRTGFWQNSQGNGWAQLTGPTSSLGMPLTNEYETDPGYAARQDFVGGWLNWVSGVCGMHTWPVCSPGWTTDGWNPAVSYRIAQIYEANGAWTHFGNPIGKAYAVMDGWEQVFDNDVIFVPNNYLVGGQGGPEIGPVDLVSVFGADSCDLSVQTWFQNDPGPSYSFSGMDGWKHVEPPACYNTWLVRRAVVMDIDSDGDGDLLNCFDYGNNETRFHAFLQDPENLEFDYQGDAGVWHVGGPLHKIPNGARVATKFLLVFCDFVYV